VAGAAAGIGIAFALLSKEAASDEQALRKLQVVMGDLSKEAEAFSATWAEATGRQEGEVQATVAQAQLLLETFGLSREEAFKFSKELVKGATDATAVLGGDLGGAVEEIARGLIRGGAALKSYGIDVSEARVQQTAMEQGLLDASGKMDETTESTIKLQLAVADLQKRFGGAATSDTKTFAESWRALKDLLTETASTFGQFVNEAVAPFIKGLTSVVKSVRAWAAANPVLISTLVKIGLALVPIGLAAAALVGTVAAVSFAWKQYAAAVTLAQAATLLLSTAFTASTAATTANTAALSANAAMQKSAATSGLVTVISKIRAILAVTTGELIANTRAWIANAAAQLGVKGASLGGTLSSLAQGFAVFTGNIIGSTVALATGKIGLTAFTAQVTGGMLPALTASVASLSALGVAAAGLAVAFVGFKVGGYIEEWLGLADAQERVQKGTATLGDTIKSKLVDGLLLAIGPIGWAGLAWKKYYEYQAEANREAQKRDIEESLKQFNPEQIRLYNQYLKEGMVDWRALKAAVNDTAGQITRFQFLLGQKRSGAKLTDDQLIELEARYDQLSTSVKGFADQYAAAMGRVVTVNGQAVLTFSGANAILKKTADEFEKAKTALGGEQVKINLGEGGAEAVKALDDLGKTLELFDQRAKAHVAIVDELNKKQPTSNLDLSPQIAAQKTALAELSRLAQQAADQQARIIEASMVKQIDAAKKFRDEEVAVATKRKDDLVKIEQEKVDRIKEQLDRETGIREAANQKAQDFVARLLQDELRRKNAQAADIQQLAESAAASLKDVDNQNLRAQALELVTKRIQELTQATQEEINLKKTLASQTKDETNAANELAKAKEAEAKAKAELSKVPAGEDTEAQTEAVKRAAEATLAAQEKLNEEQAKTKQLQADLAAEEQKRADAAKFAEQEIARLYATSAKQAEDAAARQTKITELQKQQLEAQQKINTAEEAYKTAVEASNAAFDAKVAAAKELLAVLLKMVEAEKQLVVARASGDQSSVKAAEQTVQTAQTAVQQQVKTQQPTQQAEQAAGAFDALAQQYATQFKEAVDAAAAKVEASAAAVAKADEAFTAADVRLAAVEQELKSSEETLTAQAAAVAQVTQTVDAASAGIQANAANMTPAILNIGNQLAAVNESLKPTSKAVVDVSTSATAVSTSVQNMGRMVVDAMQKTKTQLDTQKKSLDALSAKVAALMASSSGSGEVAATGN
jgi:hypothetical protein